MTAITQGEESSSSSKPGGTDELRTVAVSLGDRSYDIRIGPGGLAGIGQAVAELGGGKPRRVHIVTDETVQALFGAHVRESLTAQGFSVSQSIIPPGEESKSWSGLQQASGDALAAGLARSDVFLALGGGVVGDLCGLVAGLHKRGARFVQVPTTLLSQVDSSVGGKTAINTAQGKNLVGLFHQPSLVIIDPDVLKTLPDRQMRAGFAEVVKYGLIDDPAFFWTLVDDAKAILSGDPARLVAAIEHACRAKARVVAADETEKGNRALLNLGHTFGHAIERANGFGEDVLHGEAVALGCVLAFRYSARSGLCPEEDAQTVTEFFRTNGYATRLSNLPGGPYISDALQDHMTHDKKMTGSGLTLVLARGIGQAFLQPDADMAGLRDFLEAETRP